MVLQWHFKLCYNSSHKYHWCILWGPPRPSCYWGEAVIMPKRTPLAKSECIRRPLTYLWMYTKNELHNYDQFILRQPRILHCTCIIKICHIFDFKACSCLREEATRTKLNFRTTQRTEHHHMIHTETPCQFDKGPTFTISYSVLVHGWGPTQRKMWTINALFTINICEPFSPYCTNNTWHHKYCCLFHDPCLKLLTLFLKKGRVQLLQLAMNCPHDMGPMKKKK